MPLVAVPRGEAAGFAPRVGIRGGLVATLTGGVLTVFAATLHAFGIGHPAENGGWLTLFALVLPHARPFQILLVTLLGIPPAIFFGMAGAFITAMLRNPVPPSGASSAASASHSRPARSAPSSSSFPPSDICHLSRFRFARNRVRPHQSSLYRRDSKLRNGTMISRRISTLANRAAWP